MIHNILSYDYQDQDTILKSLLSSNIFQASEDISEEVKKSHHVFA